MGFKDIYSIKSNPNLLIFKAFKQVYNKLKLSAFLRRIFFYNTMSYENKGEKSAMRV